VHQASKSSGKTFGKISITETDSPSIASRKGREARKGLEQKWFSRSADSRFIIQSDLKQTFQSLADFAAFA
jgi:hypothetical protein